jgi:predicted TIM-barrel fold metal-dependent hydrolase
MLDLPIISADDHVDLYFLPPTLWQERLPAGLRAAGPAVVDGPDGKVWQAEGRIWGPSGRKVAGAPGATEYGYRPGIPQERLRDMDRDGVHAQVIYGHTLGFPCADPALQAAVMVAYNDWAADFNRAAPERLCVLPILPPHDIGLAAAELRRVAELGHRGAQLSPWDAAEPLYERDWDPVWSVAEETGIPISFHIGGGLHSLGNALERGGAHGWMRLAGKAAAAQQLDEVLAWTIFSGILERHPRLKVVMAESGIGWIPYLIERMEDVYDQYPDQAARSGLRRRPREQFAEQVYVTFEKDPVGVGLIPAIGPSNVMWASDYPHGESTFPHSRRVIEESLGMLDPISRAKVVSGNAAGLYRM